MKRNREECLQTVSFELRPWLTSAQDVLVGFKQVCKQVKPEYNLYSVCVCVCMQDSFRQSQSLVASCSHAETPCWLPPTPHHQERPAQVCVCARVYTHKAFSWNVTNSLIYPCLKKVINEFQKINMYYLVFYLCTDWQDLEALLKAQMWFSFLTFSNSTYILLCVFFFFLCPVISMKIQPWCWKRREQWSWVCWWV